VQSFAILVHDHLTVGLHSCMKFTFHDFIASITCSLDDHQSARDLLHSPLRDPRSYHATVAHSFDREDPHTNRNGFHAT
jgi:hypothetical protein